MCLSRQAGRRRACSPEAPAPYGADLRRKSEGCSGDAVRKNADSDSARPWPESLSSSMQEAMSSACAPLARGDCRPLRDLRGLGRSRRGFAGPSRRGPSVERRQRHACRRRSGEHGKAACPAAKAAGKAPFGRFAGRAEGTFAGGAKRGHARSTRIISSGRVAGSAPRRAPAQTVHADRHSGGGEAHLALPGEGDLEGSMQFIAKTTAA